MLNSCFVNKPNWPISFDEALMNELQREKEFNSAETEFKDTITFESRVIPLIYFGKYRAQLSLLVCFTRPHMPL